MTRHCYIQRTTGGVVEERLRADLVLEFLYSRAREHAPSLFRMLTGARASQLIGFLHFDAPLGARILGRRLVGAADVDLSECLDPIEHFDSARKLFERRIRYWECRPMREAVQEVVSPADSRALLGSLAANSKVFVKEKFFSFEELLGNRRKWIEAFAGDTRKSCYEGGRAGVPVAPIQAVSSIVLTAIGLLGAGLFLAGRFELSFGVAAVLSLAWRVLSEALRADDRGSGRLTPYQRMSLFGILYCFILLELAGSTAERLPLPDLMLGAGLLWRPETILLLESLAIALFLATGRSRVIVSRLSFHLKRAEPNSVEWSPQSCARP